MFVPSLPCMSMNCLCLHYRCFFFFFFYLLVVLGYTYWYSWITPDNAQETIWSTRDQTQIDHAQGKYPTFCKHCCFSPIITDVLWWLVYLSFFPGEPEIPFYMPNLTEASILYSLKITCKGCEEKTDFSEIIKWRNLQQWYSIIWNFSNRQESSFLPLSLRRV